MHVFNKNTDILAQLAYTKKEPLKYEYFYIFK